MDKMKQFQYKLQSRLMQMLYGRNGADALGRACNIVAIVLLVINIILNSTIIYFLWVGFFGYSIFRIFSKNIPKRYAENRKYLELTAIPRKRLNLVKMQWRDRKTSRYFVCKKCHQQIRVPRGKGKIEIRCPKCSERFIKRT